MRRDRAPGVFLKEVKNLIAPGVPILRRFYGTPVKKRERIGKLIVPRQGVKVRWQLVGLLHPLVERRYVRQDLHQVVAVLAPLLKRHGQRRLG
jgi:hypothetical protein